MNPRPANDFVPTNVWNDPQSFRDEIDYYENVALHYRRVARRAKWLGRFGFANRATRLSARAVFHRLGHAASVAIAENCIPAALGLLTGMMLTVGLAYIWALFL